ncbi:hypothetical protein SNEBB_000354 [Seison nebaliae]|nr:hypothetical protein SNEBB_000354 [Seison nebaliae]
MKIRFVIHLIFLLPITSTDGSMKTHCEEGRCLVEDNVEKLQIDVMVNIHSNYSQKDWNQYQFNKNITKIECSILIWEINSHNDIELHLKNWKKKDGYVLTKLEMNRLENYHFSIGHFNIFLNRLTIDSGTNNSLINAQLAQVHCDYQQFIRFIAISYQTDKTTNSHMFHIDGDQIFFILPSTQCNQLFSSKLSEMKVIQLCLFNMSKKREIHIIPNIFEPIDQVDMFRPRKFEFNLKRNSWKFQKKLALTLDSFIIITIPIIILTILCWIIHIVKSFGSK